MAWQPSDLSTARTRWAVGVVQPKGEGLELRYFSSGPEFERLNPGRSFAELLSLGYVGYPAFSPETSVHRDGVKAALIRRLPPRQRSDFSQYLAQFRLKPEAPLSDMALLARTEAKLPSDGFSLVDPLDASTSKCDLLLEVAGFRHYCSADNSLQLGMAIEILPEPDNEFDPGAVQVRAEGKKIGNINRLQAPTFLHWLRYCSVEGTLERLNGSSDRPRAYIFVRVRPTAVKQAA